MNPAPLPVPIQPALEATRRCHKAVLRLVKGGPERAAVEDGQIDAILDPDSGEAMVLPQALKELLQRQAARRSLVGLAVDGWWEQDEEHRFVFHEPEADQGPGLGDADIIGRTLWDLPVDNISHADWQIHRQQLAWHATFRDLEVRRIDDRGVAHYLAISGEPIFDEEDRFRGYRGVLRNLTEARRFEIAVLQPNRFARTALDSMAVPVCVLDQGGAVLLANLAWRVFASTRAGVGPLVGEGGNYLDACDGMDGGQHEEAIAIAAGIRQVIAGERELFLHDSFHLAGIGPGESPRLSLRVTEVADHGPARAVISIEDADARKRLEAGLSAG
jgi:PAS domain S-box-containing protein